ncbi:MAG: hypothetical protein KKA65_04145 [Nanoarchaeota archaeon]|nr:hypothetical protein [Nanoarchaeota archaeon]MBU4241694.1 hypothetical protein [Nanoarchaeota archaeon]MBU4351779.1 hypothetical protein [Nanoarchaeota archaeon]MBU4456669.1 hypothetical protein [Nanoarchaeota archaeon]MCG2719449.1 hypothetical protein [Nanoarchaeota archaeon]
MSLDLVMDITYYSKDGSFKILGNVEKKDQLNILSNFLRTQICKGYEIKKANEFDAYHISLKFDSSEDRYEVSDNTGNKGLRDGILMYIMAKL